MSVFNSTTMGAPLTVGGAARSVLSASAAPHMGGATSGIVGSGASVNSGDDFFTQATTAFRYALEKHVPLSHGKKTIPAMPTGEEGFIVAAVTVLGIRRDTSKIDRTLIHAALIYLQAGCEVRESFLSREQKAGVSSDVAFYLINLDNASIPPALMLLSHLYPTVPSESAMSALGSRLTILLSGPERLSESLLCAPGLMRLLGQMPRGTPGGGIQGAAGIVDNILEKVKAQPHIAFDAYVPTLIALVQRFRATESDHRARRLAGMVALPDVHAPTTSAMIDVIRDDRSEGAVRTVSAIQVLGAILTLGKSEDADPLQALRDFRTRSGGPAVREAATAALAAIEARSTG